MQFSKQDQNHAENLVKILKRVRLEVEGLEVLALADTIKWVGQLATNIKTEVEAPEPEPKQVELEPTPKPSRGKAIRQ